MPRLLTNVTNPADVRSSENSQMIVLLFDWMIIVGICSGCSSTFATLKFQNLLRKRSRLNNLNWHDTQKL